MVGFRFYVKQKANELDVKGFVRNELDGSVYVEVEGEEKNLKDFVRLCRKGPTLAKVKKVEAEMGTLRSFENFEIYH